MKNENTFNSRATHHVGFQPQLVRHALCEACVAAAEDGHWQDAALKLAVVAPAVVLILGTCST